MGDFELNALLLRLVEQRRMLSAPAGAAVRAYRSWVIDDFMIMLTEREAKEATAMPPERARWCGTQRDSKQSIAGRKSDRASAIRRAAEIVPIVGWMCAMAR